MKIDLENISRRYGREWIFRNLSYQFHSPEHYAITGPNGSGKSTLIKILSSSLSPTSGKISFSSAVGVDANREIKAIRTDEVFNHLGVAAPYLTLIEEFSLSEMIRFHMQFKKLLPSLDFNQIINLIGLQKHAAKRIHDFSSGMKQRVKLALAVFFQNEMILLDEPTMNLDADGIKWYREMIRLFSQNRLLIIGSNQEHDFDFCNDWLAIEEYK